MADDWSTHGLDDLSTCKLAKMFDGTFGVNDRSKRDFSKIYSPQVDWSASRSVCEFSNVPELTSPQLDGLSAFCLVSTPSAIYLLHPCSILCGLLVINHPVKMTC